jgi:hypothetical protein
MRLRRKDTIKKLIILILVLGMAPWANAAFEFELSVDDLTDGPYNVTEISLEICEELVIGVHGPAGVGGYHYLILEGDFPGAGGEWGDDLGPPYMPLNSGYYYEKSGYPKTLLDAAGNIAAASRYEEVGWGFGYEMVTADTEGPDNIIGGKEFEFMFHCAGLVGDVTITLWDDNFYGELDTIVIHQVPEPATIVLLALGGLALLRRRKH